MVSWCLKKPETQSSFLALAFFILLKKKRIYTDYTIEKANNLKFVQSNLN